MVRGGGGESESDRPLVLLNLQYSINCFRIISCNKSGDPLRAETRPFQFLVALRFGSPSLAHFSLARPSLAPLARSPLARSPPRSLAHSLPWKGSVRYLSLPITLNLPQTRSLPRSLSLHFTSSPLCSDMPIQRYPYTEVPLYRDIPM